ncbi:SDR family NAD(P)-dependent oxidoreductase [Bacillus aquiflavi]|uniref:SDR family NAD(P)-dependent oxidoreductase n=1 Tax=Bacillus aquiflavi TaxID=2672567 RepID=A0A6B3VYC9_9BACI|nr:SDR family NAD(P)-dependent oxidoreductase [Bacillus aquiflavi]MBA4536375.1 SDR family NAD(P)-dependent oxidoreductase [Bacillus aquiflavi]NEY80743.1 SDR family NAD(P)-dependent oxidoreductase [Bacillus aquiflavi]UAC48068.1 SDR family NAD(P)-dependent oxidoreductase [Bacillus aquiflavi]
MIISLKNKNILLVGGSSDLGKDLLKKLLKEGCRVGATYFKNKIDLNNEFEKYKENLFIEQVNVKDNKSIKEGISKLIKKLNRVDVFIYNSGVCSDSLFGLMRIQDWEHVMDVNINGAFLSSKIVTNHMVRNKLGKVLFIASTKGLVGSYGQANYSASKAALIGLMKSLAKDLGKFNISVNAVCPGFIMTNLNKNDPRKKQAAIESSVLSKVSTAEELSNFILYLISDYVSTVSGQVFKVDSRM